MEIENKTVEIETKSDVMQATQYASCADTARLTSSASS